MNDTTTDDDQTDEDILTFEASDEALEAAAGVVGEIRCSSRRADRPRVGADWHSESSVLV